MNDQLQKIHDLLESSDKAEKALGKDMLLRYMETVEIDVKSLVNGMTYDVTIISWNNNNSNPSPHIKVRHMFPFEGIAEWFPFGSMLKFGKGNILLDRIVSISPAKPINYRVQYG